MSWYVFSESDMQALEEAAPELLEYVEEHGRVSEHMTVVVNLPGPKAFAVTATTGKRPRRMARDPPINTRPA